MDVSIQEIDSAVHLTDRADGLDPQLVEAVVRIVMERVKEHQKHQRRVEDERQLWPGVSTRESSHWA